MSLTAGSTTGPYLGLFLPLSLAVIIVHGCGIDIDAYARTRYPKHMSQGPYLCFESFNRSLVEMLIDQLNVLASGLTKHSPSVVRNVWHIHYELPDRYYA